MMERAWQRLDWDSTAFGIGVAAWALKEVDGSTWLRDLDAMKLEGIRLVYVFLDPEDLASAGAVTETGARLVDRKVTYAHDLSVPPAVAVDGIESWAHGQALGRLDALALASGAHSRFLVDPAFPRAGYEALYRAWIRRSLAREIADDVLVAGDAEGMVTVKVEPGAARIGLIAVEEHRRGQGWGRRLISAVETWAWDRDLRQVKVTTQADNHHACRLYERCGYGQVALTHVYHQWI